MSSPSLSRCNGSNQIEEENAEVGGGDKRTCALVPAANFSSHTLLVADFVVSAMVIVPHSLHTYGSLLLGIASPEDHFTNFDPERSNDRRDQHQEPVLTAERGRLEDVLHPRDQGRKEDEGDRRHGPENHR